MVYRHDILSSAQNCMRWINTRPTSPYNRVPDDEQGFELVNNEEQNHEHRVPASPPRDEAGEAIRGNESDITKNESGIYMYTYSIANSQPALVSFKF